MNIDIVATQREIGQRSLYKFIERAWHVVEPGTPFRGNWHVGAIAEHLQAVRDGQIRNLGINVPPGMTKSRSVSVMFPAWAWIDDPALRFIAVSFDMLLTQRDGREMAKLIQSEWYKDRWGDKVTVPEGSAAGYFENLQGGWRFNTSVEGKMTGRHCDIMIIDDPIKPKEVSEVSLKNCETWWRGTVPSRFKDQTSGRIVLIMQRLHEGDLAGIAQKEDGWEWLVLPMRYEKGRGFVSVFDWKVKDPRTTEGELLDAGRFPEAEVKRMEKIMGSRETAAQFQQRPAPEAGAIFQRKWFKHYKVAPARFNQMFQSWDCAFKDTDGSDYVCGGVWGVNGAEYYLLDVTWERLDFVDTMAAIESMSRRYPKTILKLVEDKANGPAVINMLKKKVPGLVPVEPDGGKESRAHACAPLFEAGNVYFPDPSIAPWIDDFENEMATFPFAVHDDRVDMVTQALNYMHQKAANYAKAMENVQKNGWL